MRSFMRPSRWRFCSQLTIKLLIRPEAESSDSLGAVSPSLGDLGREVKTIYTGSDAAQIDIKPSYGLSSEDTERLLLEGYKFAEQDKNLRHLQETKVEAQRELEALTQALRMDAALLSEQQLTDLQAAQAKLEQELQGTDIKAIESAVEQLKIHSDAFAAARMNQHIDAALKGTKLDDWSNSN